MNDLRAGAFLEWLHVVSLTCDHRTRMYMDIEGVRSTLTSAGTSEAGATVLLLHHNKKPWLTVEGVYTLLSGRIKPPYGQSPALSTACIWLRSETGRAVLARDAALSVPDECVIVSNRLLLHLPDTGDGPLNRLQGANERQ